MSDQKENKPSKRYKKNLNKKIFNQKAILQKKPKIQESIPRYGIVYYYFYRNTENDL